MPRLRLTLGVVLAAVATFVAMVCGSAPAFALPPPGTNITVTSAGPTSGNPYQLTVVADDANGLQLTSPDGGTTPPMTVHIFNSSHVDVYDVTAMAYLSGMANDQVWTETGQIPQADLPAGTYTMTVDMYDAQESDIGVAAPAPLSFSYTSTMTVAANPPSVTQGSQNVTFNGTVTGVATGGTPVGIAYAHVYLDGGTTAVATTNSSGNFSYPLTGITQTATYNFSINADPGGTYSAANASVTVPAQQATTAIQVTANPTSVSEGSPGVTFTGDVTVTPQGSSTAAGIGSGIQVNVSVNGGTPTFAANTTDANGDFSYPAPAISATTTYTFSVASTNLYSATFSTPVTIQANQAQTTIAATPNPAFVTYGSQNVSFNGTVTALPPGGTTVPVPGAQVYVNGGSTSVGPTDSNGKFSYSPAASSASTTYTFSIDQTNLYTGYSDPVTVNAIDGQTNVAVTANPSFVHLGSSTVNFSGAVTVTPAGASTAVPITSGVPVYLNGGTTPVAMTDSNGDFSYTATGVTQTSTFDFSVNAGTLYTAGTYDVSVNLAQLTTNLAVTPDQTSVTEGSQTVTFAGTVTGIPPGSTTSQPIGGVPVDLAGATTNPVATTDAKGQFIYQPPHAISSAGQFDFSVGSTPTYTAATDDVAIGVIPAASRFAGVKVTPAHLKYGQKATLSGIVEYRYGTTWTPLAAATVHLFEGKTSVGRVSTGKDGTFTASLATTHGSAWRATVNAENLLQQASAIGNLSISVPMRVKSFTAKLDVLGSVKTSGCLQVTIPVHYGPESKVFIQYAARARGPWKTLGKLQLYNVAGAPALCRDANESYFGGSIRAKLANAYYRADFPGNYSFQPTESSVIHSWRYQTRITGYKVSPRAISTGDKVKITGRLWWHGKSWQPYGGRKVNIIYNEKGTHYWSQLGKPVETSVGGYFSETAVGGSGKFVAIIYAVYAGSKTDLQVQSPGISVAVNEASTPGQPPPAARGMPVILLPTYRGLGMLASDAVAIAVSEVRALASWPR
ncbi:MAG: beta strand repeat-containing protein [Streptosporangiaceae bacterium]